VTLEYFTDDDGGKTKLDLLLGALQIDNQLPNPTYPVLLFHAPPEDELFMKFSLSKSNRSKTKQS
jgi:hypothetical protein